MSSSGTVCSSFGEQKMNTSKNYICRKCNKNYDFQMAGNNFVGRIPLILNCKHSICQECVHKMYPSKDIICPECHTSNFITDIEFKKKADQVFSVNFYILGVLAYHKRYGYGSSNINFKPSGFQFKQPMGDRGHEYQPNTFLSFVASSSQRNLDQFHLRAINVPQQVCSQENCQKEAKVNCGDCDELYCTQCFDTIHNAAKGLKKHRMRQLSEGDCLELTETCPLHANALIEFMCNTCNENLCCYCILNEHSGHSFQQVTQVDKEGKEEFKDLIETAEEVMKRLLISEEKVRRLLQKPTKPSTFDNSIELQVSKQIGNAIAKLQMLENELLSQVQSITSKDKTSLRFIQENLVSNIRSVSNLVMLGKDIVNCEDGSKKVNIHTIKKLLESVNRTACYFIEKEEKYNSDIKFCFDDTLIEALQQSAKLNYTESSAYSLVSRDELPADYDDDDIQSTVHSVASSGSSFIDSMDSRNRDKSRSKTLIETENVVKWIQSTSAPQQPKKFCGTKDTRYSVEMSTFRKADRETVRVTHLTSPDCFYVQLLKMSGSLNKLLRNIDKYVRSNSIITVQIPEIKSLYLVRYVSDGVTHWCRGRVMEELPEQKMFMVYFIDYGNTATVKREDIAMLPSDLKQTIPLAIKCKFFDLYPAKGEWDPKAVYLMTKIITNHELLMIVTEASANILEVDLITTDCDTSVRDALKFLGYGIPYCKYPTDLDKIKKLNMFQQLKNTESVKLYNKTEQYKKEDSVNVIITYAINPDNIYVNLKNTKNDLIKLHESMDSFYRENKKGYVFSPKKEMVVAVRYSNGISTGWRRGIITQSTEGRGMVTARLVDIGMVISVPWDQIRKLDGRFIAQDCQAKLVKMTHVIPPNGNDEWPPNSVEFFTKYIQSEAVLRMVISETTNPPEVVFFECFPDVHRCLNAMLVKSGFAESTGDLSAAIEWPQVRTDSSKDSDESFTISMLKTIQATSHHQEASAKDTNSDEELSDRIWKKAIEVISAESPDLIYVNFTDHKEKMHEFQLELKHFYIKNKMTSPVLWQVGHTCVVNHRKRYYRGIIMETLSNDKYLVFLSDYATNVEVKAKQLGILDSRFTKDPQFAIRCHLTDITPAGGTDKWSAMACEFLQDVLRKNDKLYLSRKGVIDKERKSIPVVIWFTEFLPGGALESSKTILHSVNKLLLKNGLALKSTIVKTSARESPDKEKDLSPQLNGTEITNKDDDKDSVTSANTETEDHECSSSTSSNSVAGALKRDTSAKINWNDLIEIQKQYDSQIIREWMSPLPFKNNEFTAIPTFVNDNGEIFLHDIEMEPLFKNMEEKMLEYFDSRTEPDIDLNWVPGEMCSVRYFANKKWYRGKVLSVNDSVIKVIMVDYGNEDDCNVNDLSKEILYYDLPVFANRVILDGVFPKQNQWLTSDLDILHAQIVDKQVDVRLVTQQILGVPTPAIVKLGTLNINEFMISHSNNLSRINIPRTSNYLTLPRSTSGEVNSQSDNDVIIEEIDISSSEEESAEDIFVTGTTKELDINFDHIKLSYKQSPTFTSFKPGDKVDIAIINVVDYNKIIFEMAATEQFEKGKKSFEEMSTDINFFVLEQPSLKTFDVGQVCIARYSEDDRWYRAQVIEDLNDEVYIWFVDFGNFESLRKEHVKEAQDCWLELPVDHNIATIHGIKIINEEERQKALSSMISNCDAENTCQTAEIVTKDPLSIKLYKKGTDTLSYQHLIDSGILQVIEENGTDENGTDENGTEGNGTEENGTEGNGTEENGTEESGTEENGTGENGTE